MAAPQAQFPAAGTAARPHSGHRAACTLCINSSHHLGTVQQYATHSCNHVPPALPQRHNSPLVTTRNPDETGDDSLLPRVIADAAAAAAGLPLGPAGPVVTAIAAPYLEAVAQWAWDTFGEDSKNPILGMLARAPPRQGWTQPGSPGASAGTSRPADRLLTAIRGASSTAWPPKVTAIGYLLAKGLNRRRRDRNRPRRPRASSHG